MSIDQHTEINESKLMDFVFSAVGEVGTTLNAALVVLGDKLGLYQALAEAGPLTPAELAGRSGTAERYVREWLNAQAAGGFVTYDPETGRDVLPPEQAVALTDPGSPAYLPGFFQLALGAVLDSRRIMEAARTGAGFGWHEHGTDVLDGCERFFRPGYNANLISGWLPALDGVVGKLEHGAPVADRVTSPALAAASSRGHGIPTAPATSNATACACMTKCTGAVSRPCSRSRLGRSSIRGTGRCRSPISPGTAGLSPPTGGATAAQIVRRPDTAKPSSPRTLWRWWRHLPQVLAS